MQYSGARSMQPNGARSVQPNGARKLAYRHAMPAAVCGPDGCTAQDTHAPMQRPCGMPYTRDLVQSMIDRMG